jgi:hypoxanthine phosphoribosyltransferase
LRSDDTKIKAKPFELLLPQDRIQKKTAELGQRISADYAGKDLVLLGVLKGSFIFMADLIRQISVPAEVEFISAQSYGSALAPGELTLSGGPEVSLTGRHVLLVEAIVDTGQTAESIIGALRKMEPASVEIVTLLNKTGRRQTKVPIKYAGFTIGDDFVIGYGLDHGQLYRNLPFIGKVIAKSEDRE